MKWILRKVDDFIWEMYRIGLLLVFVPVILIVVGGAWALFFLLAYDLWQYVL